MSNLIDSPKHYTSGGIETIDFIRAKLEAVALRLTASGIASNI
jgi:hypothetical protein